MKLLLASTSPHRKKLLEQSGFKFMTQKPLVDEEKLKKNSKVPLRETPLFLAKEKAKSLIEDYSDCIVVGSDQVAILDKEILNKPNTKNEAFDRLKKLSGRTHELLTAVAVWHNKNWYTHIEQAVMTMHPLSDQEISTYIERDNPIGCAGAYKIESHGITLFKTIETKDHTSIIGLPLLALCQILRDIQEFPN